jgi:cytochrome c6
MSAIKLIVILIIGCFSSLMLFIDQPVLAADLSQGAKIFEVQCAGCHPNGNNIIRRSKTLKLKALQRNKIDSIEAIEQLVMYGKNNMSAYQERLTSAEITAVASYVLTQAENNWR